MKSALVLASIAASASAFAPTQQGASATRVAATKADLESLAEKANPVVKFYDPLNLAEAEFYGWSNEATIGFLRQSEIKVRKIFVFSGIVFRKQLTLLFSISAARTHCHVRLRWIHCPR